MAVYERVTLNGITGLRKFHSASFMDNDGNAWNGPAYEAKDVEELVAKLNATIVNLVLGKEIFKT